MSQGTTMPFLTKGNTEFDNLVSLRNYYNDAIYPASVRVYDNEDTRIEALRVFLQEYVRKASEVNALKVSLGISYMLAEMDQPSCDLFQLANSIVYAAKDWDNLHDVNNFKILYNDLESKHTDMEKPHIYMLKLAILLQEPDNLSFIKEKIGLSYEDVLNCAEDLDLLAEYVQFLIQHNLQADDFRDIMVKYEDSLNLIDLAKVAIDSGNLVALGEILDLGQKEIMKLDDSIVPNCIILFMYAQEANAPEVLEFLFANEHIVNAIETHCSISETHYAQEVHDLQNILLDSALEEGRQDAAKILEEMIYGSNNVAIKARSRASSANDSAFDDSASESEYPIITSDKILGDDGVFTNQTGDTLESVQLIS